MVRKATIALTVVLSAFSAAAATIDRRVVGGEDAKDGEFPFLVSITGTNGICGGALLDNTTVLTAGHCLGGTVAVRAGSLQHMAGGVEAKIASRRAHPDYRLNSRSPGLPYANNDIGIIKLSSPIEQSDKISYATLAANGSDPVVDSMAIIAGWGKQEPSWSPGGDASETLAKVIIPIHARDDCAKLDPDVGDRDTFVCAGGNGKNACRYDSGSPLIDQETGQVIGVVSWGIRDEQFELCGQAPTLYTRVGRYITFINENLGGSPVGPKPDPTTMTKADEPSSTPTPDKGPQAKEDELCSTAQGPNNYGVPEDICRRMAAQCASEETQKNTVVTNFNGVEKCMESRLRA